MPRLIFAYLPENASMFLAPSDMAEFDVFTEGGWPTPELMRKAKKFILAYHPNRQIRDTPKEVVRTWAEGRTRGLLKTAMSEASRVEQRTWDREERYRLKREAEAVASAERAGAKMAEKNKDLPRSLTSALVFAKPDLRDLRKTIGEALGEASMAWEEIPTSTFDSERAVEVLDRTVEKLSAPTHKKSIVFDFDGTISEEREFPEMGPPIQATIDMMRLAKDAGIEVVIQSCRWSEHELNTAETAAVHLVDAVGWLAEHDVPYDRLVAGKPLAIAYVDDLAIPVTDVQRLRQVIEENASGFPVDGSIQAHIKKRGDKWVVTNKAGDKTLGTHDTKESAQKQLAAVEIAKHVRGAKEYPLAGSTVDGRAVRDEVPNTSSIEASLTDYKVLKGIREVPLRDIIKDPKTYFYAADDFRSARSLAAQIAESGEISPIIVVMDKEGPYVLEGAHRVVALFELKAKSIPALVVLDLESLGGNEIEAAGEAHSFGCLMIDYPKDFAKKAIAWTDENVADSQVYDTDDHDYGRESHIHTTAAYGIDPKGDPEAINKLLQEWGKPVMAKLGKISKFDSNENYDVIKVEVDSPDLHELHEYITSDIGLPGNTFPDFKPHLTLAYVHPGSCDHLLGEAPFEGEEFELKQFDYSYPKEEGAKDTHLKFTVGEKVAAGLTFGGTTPGVMDIHAAAVRDESEGQRFWMDPRGKLFPTEGLLHSDWLIEKGLAKKGAAPGNTEAKFIRDGWARINFNKADEVLYIHVISPDKVLPALRKMSAEVPASMLVRNLSIDDGTENYEENDIRVDEGEDALKAYQNRKSIRKRVRGELVRASKAQAWLLSPKGVFHAWPMDYAEDEGKHHGEFLLSAEAKKVWGAEVEDFLRGGRVENKSDLDTVTLALRQGWDRGALLANGRIYVQTGSNRSLGEVLASIPPQFIFGKLLVYEGDEGPIEVPILEGEDALDAWKKRNDIRHRVKGSIRASFKYMWVDPEGTQWPVRNDHHKWMQENEKVWETYAGAEFIKRRLAADSDPIKAMEMQGWLRVNSDSIQGLLSQLPLMKKVVKEFYIPEDREKTIVVNFIDKGVPEFVGSAMKFMQYGNVEGELTAGKIDELLKLAKKTVQDSPRWADYGNRPALAVQLGEVQRQLNEARSKDDLIRIWDQFAIEPSLDSLEAEAEEEAKEDKGKKKDEKKPKDAEKIELTDNSGRE